jgi:hypothetical protein
MSEHITHIAVYEDCASIVKHSGTRFTKAFHHALDEAFDTGLFCSGARGNHLYAVPILEQNRTVYKQGKASSEIMEQIAGAIGWLTHRAADLQMKPVFDLVENLNNPLLVRDESQMYHDAVTFRHVFSGGNKSSRSEHSLLTPATLANKMHPAKASGHIHTERVENIFTHYLMLELLNTNVFIHQKADIERFAEKIIDQSQDLYEDLRIYIRAFESPEPFKQQGYITNFNIYNENDSLIQFVRYAQESDKPHPTIKLDDAIEKAQSQSHYAQALKKGYDFLSAASSFFDEKLEKSALYDILESFHPPHRI